MLVLLGHAAPRLSGQRTGGGLSNVELRISHIRIKSLVIDRAGHEVVQAALLVPLVQPMACLELLRHPA